MFRNVLDPSTVGLALSYALTLQTNLNRFVSMFAETETKMVSVERIMEYQEAPQEAPFSIPEQGALPSKQESCCCILQITLYTIFGGG